MIGFAAGLLIVWLTVAGLVLAEVVRGWGYAWSGSGGGAGMAVTVLMAPIGSAAIAWVMCHRRDMRALRSHGRVSMAAMAWGVAVGLAGLVLAAVGVAYSPAPWIDQCVMVFSGAAGSLLLLLARRWPVGACHGCGYDLRSTLRRVPCPECGRTEHAA